MSQLRLAALVTLLAAGCYSEAAPQSTLPEPQYVPGPPGGAIDPGYGYAYATDGSGANVGPGIAATDPADPADDDDRDDDTDPAANGAFDPARDPSLGAPGSAAPVAPAPRADDVAQLDGAARFGTTSDPGDPTASVSDEEIDATLDGYGEWVQTDDYGQVCRPDATVVGVDFTPYESGGSWTYTDAGWAFACDYPWGWLPFHYGRWGWFDGFWGWAPDYYWGPAWVEWRHGSGIVGWRPLPPRHRGHRDHGHRWHDRDAPVRDHRHPRQFDSHWRFAATSDFSRPHVRSHLFGNAAEGLRMTSAVAAPPIRGRAPVRAADLMRNRFAAAGRFGQPGTRGAGPGQLRDHRGAQSFGTRPPTRTYGPTYQPPLRTDQPPVQAPGDRQLHVYQPPGSTYQPPVRTYQPGQTYQPPVRTYQPGQTYQPPVRTYQPYQPPRSYPQGQRPPLYRPQGQPQPYQPPRTYRPQAPSSPPARTWSPPSSSAPSRSWSAPSHSSSPSPSRSWSAPSHSSSPSSSSSSSHSSSSSSHSSSSSSNSSSGGHHR